MSKKSKTLVVKKACFELSFIGDPGFTECYIGALKDFQKLVIDQFFQDGNGKYILDLKLKKVKKD